MIMSNQKIKNESNSRLLVKSSPDPDNEVKGGGDEKKSKPEPEEDEDLLVEHVDHQHALQTPVMHVSEFSDVNIAERDSREVTALLPVSSVEHVPEYTPSPESVGGVEEGVEEKELKDDVDKDEKLHDEVAIENARTIVSFLLFCSPVHKGHLLQGLVSTLQLLSVLPGSSDHISDGQSTIGRENYPVGSWDAEEQSLNDQQERHPLVVDHLPVLSGICCWQIGVLHRHKVRIFNEAVLLCERLPSVVELIRSPALHRFSDIVFGE